MLISMPCVLTLLRNSPLRVRAGIFDGLHEGTKGFSLTKRTPKLRNVPLLLAFLPDPVEVLFDGSPRQCSRRRLELRAA